MLAQNKLQHTGSGSSLFPSIFSYILFLLLLNILLHSSLLAVVPEVSSYLFHFFSDGTVLSPPYFELEFRQLFNFASGISSKKKRKTVSSHMPIWYYFIMEIKSC